MKTIVFKIRIATDHLQKDQTQLNEFLSKVEVVKTSTHFVSGIIDYWSVIIFYNELITRPTVNKAKEQKFSITSSQVEQLTSEEMNRLNTLKKWREEKAQALKMPQYLICHNSELISIARMKPTQKEDLTKIKGFGDLKQLKYGDEILQLISA
jgi:superfamily II DNA helicase RecQ